MPRGKRPVSAHRQHLAARCGRSRSEVIVGWKTRRAAACASRCHLSPGRSQCGSGSRWPTGCIPFSRARSATEWRTRWTRSIPRDAGAEPSPRRPRHLSSPHGVPGVHSDCLLPTPDRVDRTVAEVDPALKTLKPRGGKRALGLACGSRPHAVELRRRGFEIVGVDISPELIDIAPAELPRRPSTSSRVPRGRRGERPCLRR